jgi:hypothetical protein
MQTATAATSLATCAVSGWMCVMYLVLRHPGYQARAAMAAAICLGAATLVTGRPPAPLRIPIAIWGAALATLGLVVLVSGGGDDGWTVIASAIFIVEGGLALASAWRVPREEVHSA